MRTDLIFSSDRTVFRVSNDIYVPNIVISRIHGCILLHLVPKTIVIRMCRHTLHAVQRSRGGGQLKSSSTSSSCVAFYFVPLLLLFFSCFFFRHYPVTNIRKTFVTRPPCVQKPQAMHQNRHCEQSIKKKKKNNRKNPFSVLYKIFFFLLSL